MAKQLDLKRECQRTRPDFVVYAPGSVDGSSGDTGNEHFLVFDGPDGSLMAVWTQSTFEGRSDQRIVFSRSADGRATWAAPRVLAGKGADPKTGKGMCSWGFPLVARKGRIYVIYSRHVGVNDIWSHTTGLMAGIYSDDAGKTWSEEQTIPMPRSKWDNPDPSVPSNWIVWQKPARLSEGKYFAGFTRWVSPKVRPPTPIKVWWGEPSVVEFLRFENLHDNPEPSCLVIRYFMSDDQALQVGLIGAPVAGNGHPKVSVVQEPSIVPLPDGRLFCVMRATTGSPWCTVSDDAGQTWRAPEPLRYRDGGPVLRHPCSPCPIYATGEGQYFLLFHNHDGHFGPWSPMESTFHRRPIYVVRGEYRKGARQPVWFSGPRFLMDNDGVPLGPLGKGMGRTDLAMYASMTFRDGEPILWYPERKFFLLGKKLPMAWLAEMDVPAK